MSNPWATWLGQYDTEHFVMSRKRGWDKFVNTAPRPTFDTLSRSEMTALGSEELADYNQARQVWNANLPTVKTQQVLATFDAINQVMASSPRDGDKLRGSVVIDALPDWVRPPRRRSTLRSSIASSTADMARQPQRATSGFR
ncbi:ATP binding protein with TniB domain [Mycobacteroides abscessus subsp. bolletii]|nr:ATP binding protein with TniB domain [Mycobacteroides abscessus subsp. bolletii]